MCVSSGTRANDLTRATFFSYRYLRISETLGQFRWSARARGKEIDGEKRNRTRFVTSEDRPRHRQIPSDRERPIAAVNLNDRAINRKWSWTPMVPLNRPSVPTWRARRCVATAHRCSFAGRIADAMLHSIKPRLSLRGNTYPRSYLPQDEKRRKLISREALPLLLVRSVFPSILPQSSIQRRVLTVTASFRLSRVTIWRFRVSR